MVKTLLATTAALAFSAALGITAAQAARPGSHRVGGHGASGKGSHYVGGHKSTAVGRFLHRHL